MTAKKLKAILEYHFEIPGRLEEGEYSYHLLAKVHGSNALRLLCIDTTRKPDVQLGNEIGGLEALLRQADDARQSELFEFLQDLYKEARPIGIPPRKAKEAYRILSRLHDLQDEKETASTRRRAEITREYNRLSLSLTV